MSMLFRESEAKGQRRNCYFGCVVIILLFLAGCGRAEVAVPTAVAATQTPLPTVTAVPEEPFRIIGYVTGNDIVDMVPFDKVTHINYAFVIPNEDGTLKTIANGWKLEDLVEQAHEQDVPVLISVGGWGHDETFEILAANPEARATLVQELVDFVEQYNLDGVDMDWEYPDPVSESPDSAENYLLLMQALGEEMRARDKLLTAAVVALGYYGEGVDTAVFDEVDFLNLMVYDKGEGHHSDFQYALDAIAYWQARGLTPEKTVLGLPFYGRPRLTSYREIVEDDPNAVRLDEVERYGQMEYYNGIPTIQQKTELALEKASGVMIWTLAQDTQDETSLLNAIVETIEK